MSTKSAARRSAVEVQREGMTIERYAEVMAYRHHFHPSRREEVLLRLGVRPQRWALASKAWAAAMADALEADDTDLVARFVHTLAAVSRRLREYPPRVEQLGEPIDPNAPEPAERAATVEVPTFLREEAAPAPSAPMTPPPAPAPMAPPPAPAPVMPTPPPALGATADISAFVPRHLLPFQRGSASPTATVTAGARPVDPRPEPAPPPPPSAPKPPGLGATADISAFVPRDLLPFAGTAPAPPSAVEAPPGAGAPPAPPRPGMFLRRFDPETGEPLATPVWEDPTPASDERR